MSSEIGIRTRSGSGVNPRRYYLKAPGGAMNLTNCRFYDSAGQMILSGIAAAAITIPLTTSYQSLKDLVCALSGGQTAWDAIASSVAGFESDAVSAQVDVSFGDAAAVVPSMNISVGRPLRLGHGIPPEKQSMMGATVNVAGEVEVSAAWKQMAAVQTSIAAAGTGAANAATVACSGYSEALFVVDSVGGGTPTLIGEVSMDGTTWQTASGAIQTSSVRFSGTTQNASAGTRMMLACQGWNWARVRWSTGGTGPVVVTARATGAPFLPPSPALDTSGRAAVTLNQNNASHDAAAASSVLMIGAEARSSDGTAVGNGDASRVLSSLLGKQVTLPHALPAQTWSYVAGTGGITNTTPVAAQAAPGAGIRHYVKGLQLVNQSTTAVEVEIRSGTTALWRAELDADSGGAGFSVVFDPPLRAAANEAINIYCSGSGKVFANLQGYSAAE